MLSKLAMVSAMMRQTLQTATLMVVIAALQISRQITVWNALVMSQRLALLDSIPWLEMVSVMMKLTLLIAIMMVEIAVDHVLFGTIVLIVPA